MPPEKIRQSVAAYDQFRAQSATAAEQYQTEDAWQPSRYLTLAKQVLGREPETALLLPFPPHPPTSNIGDLTDEEDMMLCVTVGLDPTTWKSLSEDARIPWLKRFADKATVVDTPAPTTPATGKPKGKGGRPKKGEPTVNEKVAALYLRDSCAKAWGYRKIADAIGCAPSSVQECPAYKAVLGVREQLQADRKVKVRERNERRLNAPKRNR